MVVPHSPHFFILSQTGKPFPKLRGVLEMVGFAVQVGNIAAYRTACTRENPVLLLPRGESERLTAEQQAMLLDDLHAGRFLIFYGTSPLAAKLGAGGTARTEPLDNYRGRATRRWP